MGNELLTRPPYSYVATSFEGVTSSSCQIVTLQGAFLRNKKNAVIDLLTILHKSLGRALCLYIFFARIDRVALEVLSQFCTFEHSTKCSEISFDSDSFQNC